jgi:hypothetical protein
MRPPLTPPKGRIGQEFSISKGIMLWMYYNGLLFVTIVRDRIVNLWNLVQEGDATMPP